MKKVLKILTIGVLGILLLSFLFVQYLKSDLNNSFSHEDINNLQSDIQSAKELPNQFVEVYNKVEPITNTTGILYDWTFDDYDRSCPCLAVASFARTMTMNNSRISGNRYVLAWKLEREVTQRECLNFLAIKYDFLYNNIGIEEASSFYFDSKVDALTEEQMKILTLMFKNSAFYNPLRHPEIIEKELKKMEEPQ